jgi:hypothetical protein
MEILDTTQINSLPSRAMQADFVPPSEQLITLTYGQLSDLLTQTTEKAIQPLQDEVTQLKSTIACLEAITASLETIEEKDVIRICLDIAHDRRRISALEEPKKESGKTELNRAEKIEKYLASRPDHRATFETLRGHLGIDKDLLGDAIKALMAASPGRYRIIGVYGDKRKKALIMLPI